MAKRGKAEILAIVSGENVRVVREMVEAYIGSRPDVALEMLASDVAWHGTIGGLDEGTTITGRDAVVAAFAENFGTWESLTLEAEEFLDAGDAVIVYWHEIGRSRHSAAEVETRTAVVYKVAGGLVTEVQGYMERAAALAAVGLGA